MTDRTDNWKYIKFNKSIRVYFESSVWIFYGRAVASGFFKGSSRFFLNAKHTHVGTRNGTIRSNYYIVSCSTVRNLPLKNTEDFWFGNEMAPAGKARADSLLLVWPQRTTQQVWCAQPSHCVQQHPKRGMTSQCRYLGTGDSRPLSLQPSRTTLNNQYPTDNLGVRVAQMPSAESAVCACVRHRK
jgi:hypothetical protein